MLTWALDEADAPALEVDYTVERCRAEPGRLRTLRCAWSGHLNVDRADFAPAEWNADAGKRWSADAKGEVIVRLYRDRSLHAVALPYVDRDVRRGRLRP
jgi:hypothetical protein